MGLVKMRRLSAMQKQQRAKAWMKCDISKLSQYAGGCASSRLMTVTFRDLMLHSIVCSLRHRRFPAWFSRPKIIVS